MLIICPNKFQTISIVKGTRIGDIPQQLTNLKITVGFDRRIRSIQHWIVAQERNFFDSSMLAGEPCVITFSQKFHLQKFDLHHNTGI